MNESFKSFGDRVLEKDSFIITIICSPITLPMYAIYKLVESRQ